MLNFYTQSDLFFYHKIKNAQKRTAVVLESDVEFYLVQLLSGLTDGTPAELEEPLYRKIEKATESHGVKKYLSYKDLGDTCVIMLSNFQEFIKGRGLSVNYYRDMGSLGYARAGDIADRYLDGDFAEILWKLSDKFYKIELVLRSAQGLCAPDNVEGWSEDS